MIGGTSLKSKLTEGLKSVSRLGFQHILLFLFGVMRIIVPKGPSTLQQTANRYTPLIRFKLSLISNLHKPELCSTSVNVNFALMYT